MLEAGEEVLEVLKEGLVWVPGQLWTGKRWTEPIISCGEGLTMNMGASAPRPSFQPPQSDVPPALLEKKR